VGWVQVRTTILRHVDADVNNQLELGQAKGPRALLALMRKQCKANRLDKNYYEALVR
jgi:hypothetical protein